MSLASCPRARSSVLVPLVQHGGSNHAFSGRLPPPWAVLEFLCSFAWARRVVSRSRARVFWRTRTVPISVDSFFLTRPVRVFISPRTSAVGFFFTPLVRTGNLCAPCVPRMILRRKKIFCASRNPRLPVFFFSRFRNAFWCESLDLFVGEDAPANIPRIPNLCLLPTISLFSARRRQSAPFFPYGPRHFCCAGLEPVATFVFFFSRGVPFFEIFVSLPCLGLVSSAFARWVLGWVARLLGPPWILRLLWNPILFLWLF